MYQLDITQPDCVQIIPEDYTQRFNLGELFPGEAPLQVDVGCGDGGFLLQMAKLYPKYNFIGIERLLGRIRGLSRKVCRDRLDNVRLLRLESTYSIRYLLPPSSVNIMHVSFPDPWPKRRHFDRRLINKDFLDAAVQALAPDGELRITTDHPDYFKWIENVVPKEKRLEHIDWPEDPDYPKTDFEIGFRDQGLPIHRLKLVKKSTGD